MMEFVLLKIGKSCWNEYNRDLAKEKFSYHTHIIEAENEEDLIKRFASERKLLKLLPVFCDKCENTCHTKDEYQFNLNSGFSEELQYFINEFNHKLDLYDRNIFSIVNDYIGNLTLCPKYIKEYLRLIEEKGYDANNVWYEFGGQNSYQIGYNPYNDKNHTCDFSLSSFIDFVSTIKYENLNYKAEMCFCPNETPQKLFLGSVEEVSGSFCFEMGIENKNIFDYILKGEQIYPDWEEFGITYHKKNKG